MISRNGLPISVSDIRTDDELIINACVRKIKYGKKLSFLYLKSGTDVITTVYAEDINNLKEGAYISADAVAVHEIKAERGIEIRIKAFTVLSSPSCEYSITDFENMKNVSNEAAAKDRIIALRSSHFTAVSTLTSEILSTCRNFLHDNGFIAVTTPIITRFSQRQSFILDYFGNKASLSYSPQLYMTPYTASLERVYEITHSFTAKKHYSARHLNEFTSLNFQVGYINSVNDIINIVSNCIQHVTEYLKSRCIKELDALGVKISDVQNIPVFSFDEVIARLEKPPQPDLDPTDIKKLCRIAETEYVSDFVFTVNFPSEKRPFYAMDCENSDYAQCVDLYFKGMKIGTGSRNIHDYSSQLEKLKRYNSSEELPSVYEDTLKYGIMPYGGFMLGIERFVASLLSLGNIRAASGFPRDLHHIDP